MQSGSSGGRVSGEMGGEVMSEVYGVVTGQVNGRYLRIRRQQNGIVANRGNPSGDTFSEVIICLCCGRQGTSASGTSPWVSAVSSGGLRHPMGSEDPSVTCNRCLEG